MSEVKLKELIELTEDLVNQCGLDLNTALKDVLQDVVMTQKYLYAKAIRSYFEVINVRKAA